MISLNNMTTMHEILSQVMDSKRQVRIFVDGKPFEGHVVSLSSQFVELDDSLYPNPEPFLNQIVICINSIKVISIYPKEDEGGGKK